MSKFILSEIILGKIVSRKRFITHDSAMIEMYKRCTELAAFNPHYMVNSAWCYDHDHVEHNWKIHEVI